MDQKKASQRISQNFYQKFIFFNYSMLEKFQPVTLVIE